MAYKVKTPISIPPSLEADIPRVEEKTAWQTIGNAWSDEAGGKITIALNCLPFRSEYIYLFPEDKSSAVAGRRR